MVVASLALHGAVVAALILWPHDGPLQDDGGAGSVALIFADTAALAGAPTGAGEAAEPQQRQQPQPPEPQSPEQQQQPQQQEAADPPPDPVPPVPATAAAEAEEAPAVPAPLVAEAPPQPATPAPPAEAPEPTPEAPALTEAELPPPPPAPPPPPTPPATQVAARAPAPRPPEPTSSAVRLGAGFSALPDPSLGATAVGAVVPPSPDAGTRNVPPEYPAESRQRGEEGVVRLLLRIDAAGRVQAADVAESSGHAALDRAAVAAALRWRFRPAVQDGLPVAATLRTGVRFRLTEASGR